MLSHSYTSKVICIAVFFFSVHVQTVCFCRLTKYVSLGLNDASVILNAVIAAGLIHNPLKQMPTWPAVVGFTEMLKSLFVFHNINCSWVKSRMKRILSR